MTKQLRRLGESFVAIFVFGDAAKEKLKPSQPQFGDFLMHEFVVLIGVDIVIIVSYLSVLSSAC
jgi:hypothetical protein